MDGSCLTLQWRTINLLNAISLAIVDESEFLRLGLQLAIETSGDIEVIGDFAPGEETVAEMEWLRPDVILLNMRWPATEGLAACREIREAVPSTKVVMLSSTECEEEILASIMAGASGHVFTNASKEELVRTIRVAASGGSYFDRSVTESVLGRLRELNGESVPVADQLTERELSILALMAEGCGNGEIGVRLNLATSTVRNNITQIRSKLNMDSRSKMIAYAFQHGLTGD